MADEENCYRPTGATTSDGLIPPNCGTSMSYMETIIPMIISERDDAIREEIALYAREKYKDTNYKVIFISKEKVDRIIELGLQEYLKEDKHES